MSVEVFISEWFGGQPRSVGLYDAETGGYKRHLTPRLYPDEVVEAVKLGRGVAVSVQPYTQKNQPICIEKLFFDFDSKGDLSRVWDEMLGFSLSLYHNYGVSPLLVFSGSKGYHVYCWLQQPYHADTQGLLKAVYGELQRMLLATITGRSPIFDSQVFGDIARLSRVPYSTHPKSGQLCVPVDDEQEPYRLLPGFREEYRRLGLSPEVVALAETHVKAARGRVSAPKTSKKKGGVRPCIRRVFEAKSVHDPVHVLKVAAVAELHAEGAGEAGIVDAFRGMEGFKEELTRSQVRHAIARGYKPFKCATISEMGGCFGGECPRYRREVA